MTTPVNGVSTPEGATSVRASVSSNATVLALSRTKMIMLVVEARLLQPISNGANLLPHREKDQKEAAYTNLILSQVFGSQSALNLSKEFRKNDVAANALQRIVASYFQDEELGSLSIYLNMPRFINLSDPNKFKDYLAPKLSSALDSGIATVRRVYETNRSSVSQTKYGSAFPMNPELLAYAMQLAKGETVLEIAGASGGNSAVLAFSEAERVYVNDILPQEIQEFEAYRKMLPPDVAKKLESIPGDCFDILKLKPELTKKVGFVLCRNLIHFFTDRQLEKFFTHLKQILKPGGRALFTVNGVYDPERACEKHADATSFATTDYIIYQGTQPFKCFRRVVQPCADDKVTTDYEVHMLYQKKKGEPWKQNKAGLYKLEKTVRESICAEFSSSYENDPVCNMIIPEGSVRALLNWKRLYSPKTIQQLFKQSGFQLEATVVLSDNGHLVHADDPFKLCDPNASREQSRNQPQLVGVIVRYPGESALVKLD